MIISFHIWSSGLLKLTLHSPVFCIYFHLDVRRNNSKTSSLRRVPLLRLLLKLLASFHHKRLDLHCVPSYLLFSAFNFGICFMKSIVVGVRKSLPCWSFTLLHILQKRAHRILYNLSLLWWVLLELITSFVDAILFLTIFLLWGHYSSKYSVRSIWPSRLLWVVQPFVALSKYLETSIW
jgi:hypothetical protein